MLIFSHSDCLPMPHVFVELQRLPILTDFARAIAVMYMHRPTGRAYRCNTEEGKVFRLYIAPYRSYVLQGLQKS